MAYQYHVPGTTISDIVPDTWYADLGRWVTCTEQVLVLLITDIKVCAQQVDVPRRLEI